MADQITQLTAIDPFNGRDAPFTVRLTSEEGQEVIGGKDKYVAVERRRYFQLNKMKFD